jgi:biopolymer transport protein ExbD
MVVNTFEQSEADERVRLPKDLLAKPPEQVRPSELLVNVGFERNIQGQKIDPFPFVFYAGTQENIRIRDFGPKFEIEKRAFEREHKKVADVTVVIRADSETPTGMVQELIKQAQQRGFEKFALKAAQDDSGP